MEEGSTVTINNLRYLPSRRFMRIDFNTLNALHIFHTEHHPVMAKGQSHTKEGFSLFALLDRTKSKMGRQCLKDLMLRPLLDPMEISKRQDVVSLFVDSERVASCISAMDELLPKVGAVDKIILRMQKCHSNPLDFLHLTRTLEAAIQICSVLENDLKITIAHGMPAVITGYNHGPVTVQNVSSNELEWINSLLERCHAIILHDLLKRITSIVDLEATALKKEAVVIQFGFHEALDNAKDAFDRLDGKIILFLRSAVDLVHVK
jgi:DNA mismatch repair ATPase MutS